MVTRTYVDTILLHQRRRDLAKSGLQGICIDQHGDCQNSQCYRLSACSDPHGTEHLLQAIYNRNLNLSLTYRPALFSRESAQTFLNLYAEEVRNYGVSS